MHIAVILVYFKTPDKDKVRLRNEIEGLKLNDYILYEIDNTDNNIGYAAAVNKGIRKGLESNCDNFLILNPDISLGVDIDSERINDLSKHFDIAGFAMRQEGRIYYGGEIDRWRMSGGLIEKKPISRFQKVDFVTGSCMFISKKVVDAIGFFEENYFLYYEDVDYCYRAKKEGLRVGIDSDCLYEHFEKSKGSAEKEMYLAQNRIYFFQKYATLQQKIREFVRLPFTLYENRKLVWKICTQSPFLLNFASLNISSLLNKCFSFILFLVFMRYISPSDYGLYTLAWAHVGILAPFMDFGTTSYGMIYLTESFEEKFQTLFSFRVFLSLIVFVLTVFLALFGNYSTVTRIILFMMCFIIFANMMSGTLLIASSIKQRLALPSTLSVVFNFLLISTLIILLIVYRNVHIIFPFIVLFYLSYGAVCYIFTKKLVKSLRVYFDFKKWFQIIKKSYMFVLISFFAGLYFKVDVFLLQYMKGQQDVGIYSSGYKFFEALMLFVSSYNTASAPGFAWTARHKPQLLYMRLIRHLLVVGLIGLGIVIMIYGGGYWFLPLILKNKFLQAVPIVYIVIWSLPLILWISVLINILYVRGYTKAVIWIFASQAILNAFLNIIFIPIYSFTASAYITVLSEIINLILLAWLVFFKYKKSIFHQTP